MLLIERYYCDATIERRNTVELRWIGDSHTDKRRETDEKRTHKNKGKTNKTGHIDIEIHQ